MDYTVIEHNYNIDPRFGLKSDKTILLAGYKSSKLYPDPLRLVEYYDAQNDILLTFVSNNHEVSALEIAKLYRNRWQIETFFKWIKQNLTIKKYGNSPKMQSISTSGLLYVPILLWRGSNVK